MKKLWCIYNWRESPLHYWVCKICGNEFNNWQSYLYWTIWDWESCQKNCWNENSPQQALKQIIRDTAIAIEHIVLEAEDLGLSTCWVADFIQEQIRPVLNIPADKYVVCILTLGYADESPKARPRKRLEDIVHYENW